MMIRFGSTQLWLGVAIGSLALVALAAAAAAQSSAPKPSSPNQEVATTPDPLAHRVASLKAQIRVADEQIAVLQQRMPELERQLDKLAERAGAVQLRNKEEETEPSVKAPPREVAFGTPIALKAKKKTPILLVCEEGRVSIADFEMVKRELDRTLTTAASKQRFVESKGGTFDADDFEVRVALIILGPIAIPQQQAIRKRGRAGESLEEVRLSSSRLRQRLGRLRTQAHDSVIQFAVYPDSYDVFRAVRQMAWEKAVEVCITWRWHC
jgi:hypothetical protein